jgi:hypothetical protein
MTSAVDSSAGFSSVMGKRSRSCAISEEMVAMGGDEDGLPLGTIDDPETPGRVDGAIGDKLSRERLAASLGLGEDNGRHQARLEHNSSSVMVFPSRMAASPLAMESRIAGSFAMPTVSMRVS